jgi:hypothetical protein
MTYDFWIIAALGPVLCVGTAVAFATRRRSWRAVTQAAFTLPDGSGQPAEYLPTSVEAAERQLGMLLRRMRAYWRAPYDFASSRIVNDTDFERCLDLATALGIRIEELSGGLIAAPAERERIRNQIVLSLSPKPAPFGKPGRPADHAGFALGRVSGIASQKSAAPARATAACVAKAAS